MTLQEKILLQNQNPQIAFAFKEGFFYKVYNEGIWLLRNKNFKIQYKGKEVSKYLSIGFPETVIKSLQYEFKIVNKPNIVEIHFDEPVDILIYNKWKIDITSSIDMQLNHSVKINCSELFLNEIKNYPLAIKSPIDVFIWIHDLQSRILQN